MIEIKNLNKTYGKGNSAFTALKSITVTLEQGANMAILGKSGSGKSTLMHVIAGLDRPTSGEVIINNVSVWAMPAKKLDAFRNKTIGFIFQAFFLQNENTVLENVMVPLEIRGVPFSKRRETAIAALKSVDLLDKMNNKASDLSGGQKQRVVIARSIVGDPDIIFADEPTGNLDSVTGGIVEDMLFDLNKNTKAMLIVVTHDDELAKRFDNRIVLKDGEIIEMVGKGVTS
ncbi:ABC transporter ATP-binding protein [candidate division WWE3 bacterium CG_4_9_14_3_um_filter_41_6]|uniref:ABC transporter ATP-binding protein n=1 Tax=candidate division WWE3 bacterium CG_4_10_14_0_2_um_filter_41_14 TaxID=1975072 RepID=A0A2M7THN9_UNCKA|nr:MAG: ABC transporter ATP-binding protein [candidate division WWE3 bacterium CG_4_10_14_0_2_um_filter_41_14]PJA38122.1 MAG: ABC transporter ATP-binding protein [candidate division WWE3 bacterium CG_4_9_14_3_um_filter_41_6]